ncbi:11166_t:CDS:2, partial [Funneliformis caledonium]
MHLHEEGRISMLNLLGFHDKNNVKFLRSIINAKFSTIFKDTRKTYAAINKDDITLSSNSTSNIMSDMTVSQE